MIAGLLLNMYLYKTNSVRIRCVNMIKCEKLMSGTL